MKTSRFNEHIPKNEYGVIQILCIILQGSVID